MDLFEQDYNDVDFNNDWDNDYEHPYYGALTDYDARFVFYSFLLGDSLWTPLINGSMYQKALSEFVQFGELHKFPTQHIYKWMGIIMKNTAILRATTEIAGHSMFFPYDEFLDEFFEGDEDLFIEYCQKHNIEVDEDDLDNTASEYLDQVGFFGKFCVLPDGSDAWSDFGLEPIEKLIAQYNSDMSPEDTLVLINKILDIYHCRGDLSSAFIQGGKNTLSKISAGQLIIEKKMNKNSKKSLNEMARAPRKSTIPKNIEAAVKDMIARSGYSEDYGKSVKAPSRYSDEELLQRYVFALLVYGKPCPKSEEDIDEISVFADYAKKFIDDDHTGTIEDIIDLYNQQDKLSVNKNRSGFKRVHSAYRKSSDVNNIADDEPVKQQDNIVSKATEEVPAEEFSFDEDDERDDFDDVKRQLDSLKYSLFNNNEDEFGLILNNILDTFDNIKYGSGKRNWYMMVRYDNTYSPRICRTQNREYAKSHIPDGTFSYENKSKVLKDGETIFNALDRPLKWRQGYSYWDRYDCFSHVEFVIYVLNEKDEMTFKVEVNTGKDCKQEFFDKLSSHILKAYEKAEEVLNARNAFENSSVKARYGFDKKPNNYIDWLVKYVPVILKNNNIDGKKSWYDGISIRGAECSFWTGNLQTLTPDGIIFWVGGDSTDDESKISYSEWRSSRDFKWYSNHAKVGANISHSDREDFSEQIYDYLLQKVKDGKLK